MQKRIWMLVVVLMVIGGGVLLVTGRWRQDADPDTQTTPVVTTAGPLTGTLPNILILAIDTLRADFLHCGGKANLQSPHIDALADDGVYFTNCMATAPWTGPAFASIYTGLLPYHHGFHGRQYYSLAPEQVTMAERLADAGYHTAAFVTISYLTAAFGMHQGYQTGDKFTDQGLGEEAKLVTASSKTFVDRCAAQEQAPPFFLFLHYYDVHAPYTPPAPYSGMYYNGDPRAGDQRLQDILTTEGYNYLWQQPELYTWLEDVTDPGYAVAQYGAGVTYVDSHIGQVVAYLKERGLYDDMLIILVADHGEHLGEHGIYFAHTLAYQETLHVPLIIKWPGNRYAGMRIDERVSGVDVLPTLLEMIGLPIPDGLDGWSLVDMAGGADADANTDTRQERPLPVMAEEGEYLARYCKVIYEGPWKLLNFSSDGNHYPALYNLDDDPGELHDLAEQHPDVVERLSTRLWSTFDEDNPLTVQHSAPPTDLSEAEKQRLRALGYVK